MASEDRSAAFTLIELVAATPPKAAVMVVVPRFLAVTTPLTVMLAIVGAEELHVTDPVMSWVVPSENVPVAVNCCNWPREIEELAGEMEIEVAVALDTLSVVPDDAVPVVAVILELPAATPMAKPAAPFTLMATAVGFEDVQFIEAVTFCTLPSVIVPMAVNWSLVPCAIVGFAGDTTTETTVGAVIVRFAFPLRPENIAVIVTVPAALLVTWPTLDTVAELVLEDVHVAVLVTSLLLPSL
jgi:hypothetical protein